MAINKEKNVSLQVTITKEEMEQLNTIVDSFHKEGVKCSKSDIISASLDLYIKCLVANDIASKEVEEPQKEKNDA